MKHGAMEIKESNVFFSISRIMLSKWDFQRRSRDISVIYSGYSIYTKGMFIEL